MIKIAVGEWDGWETWVLRAHLLNLEDQCSEVRNELRKRDDFKQARFTRDERKQQICRFLSNGQIFTTAQIAKQLCMSPSQNLRDILCELYNAGKIRRYSEGKVAAHPIYYWYIQVSLPLPFPESAHVAPCESVSEAVDFPF